MSDITVINDSEQSSLVTNGLAKNGELYLKAAGSTDAGAIVVYDSGVWRTFANEAVSFVQEYSISLDGSNDYVSVAHDSSLNTTTAFTLSAWVKYTSGTLAGYPQILSKRHSNTGYQFNIDNNGRLLFGVDATSFVTSSSVITAGTWNHVAVTWTSGTGAVAFYLNGAADGTGTGKTSMTSNTGALEIGHNPNFTNWYAGLMDEVAVFNSALSSSNISAIYNSGVPTDLSSYSPVGWWRFEEGSGTSVENTANPGTSDGTLTNGPTFSTDVPS
jgi:hypothetical protein